MSSRSTDRRRAQPSTPLSDALAAVDCDSLRADHVARDRQARADLADQIEAVRIGERDLMHTVRRGEAYAEIAPDLADHGASAISSLDALIASVQRLVSVSPSSRPTTTPVSSHEQHHAAATLLGALHDARTRVAQTMQVLERVVPQAARGAARDAGRAELELEQLRVRAAALLERVETLDATPRAAE